MKVKDLIKQLQEVDPEGEVALQGGSALGGASIIPQTLGEVRIGRWYPNTSDFFDDQENRTDVLLTSEK